MDYGGLIVAMVAGAVAGVVGFLIGRLLGKRAGAKLQQAVILGLVFGTAAVAVQCEPLVERVNEELGLKSTLELQMAKEGKRLLSDPRFQAATKNKDAYEYSVLASRLAGQGIALLDEPELDAWHRVRLHLAEQSTQVCAGLWNSSLSSESIQAALSALPEADVRAWSKLSIDASLLALGQSAPPTRDQETLDQGLAAIISTLPAMEQVSAREDMKLKTLGAERSCELMLLVLRGSQTLPPALKYPFLRALSQA